MKIEVIKNDFGYGYQFTLREPDGSPTDLTGAVVTLRAQHSEAESASLIKTISAEMPLASGVVLYVVDAADYPIEGVYYAEIELTAAGKKVTYPGFTILVIPKV